MSKRLLLWIFGALLLLTLNFFRDAHITRTKYNWYTIQTETLHQSVSSPGVMEAVNVAEIKSEVDEFVEKKFVAEGQTVTAGQPLIQLTQTRTKLEYDQRKNSLISAQMDLKKAQREVGIQQKLLKNLAVSRQQVEDAEQNFQKSQASLNIISQEFNLVKKKLEGTLILSPMNGIVLKDFTQIGDLISVGKSIITVGDVSEFVVKTKIDELDIQQIKIGQRVEIKADAFPDLTMTGQVRFISTQAEREAFAKVAVLISIDKNKKIPLKHNLSVRVNILTEDLPNSIGVPIQAILKKEGNKAALLTCNKFGILRKRYVTVGKSAVDKIQVLSGLVAGDLVGIQIPEIKTP